MGYNIVTPDISFFLPRYMVDPESFSAAAAEQ